MGKEVGQLLDEAESKIFQMPRPGEDPPSFMEIQPLLTQVMERIDLLYTRTIFGHHRHSHGLPRSRPRHFGTAARRPDHHCGRRRWARPRSPLNIAEHVAVDNKLPVAVFSMEMSGSQLAMRLLGSIGRLDQHKLRTGRLSDDDWNRLTNAVGKLHDAPILVDESGALNALELRARARRLHRQYGALGLIVVDYSS